MTSSYRKVLLGLRLSSAGLWLVAMSAVLVGSLELFAAVHIHRDGVHYLAVDLMARNTAKGGLGLIGIGLIVGFVGRCFCLPVPAAAGAAPARIGLAVIFEACSLLSAAALAGASYLLPLPSAVSLTWCLFGLLTAYIARTQFLRFARALAEHIAPTLAAEAKAVQRLYLYVPGGFALAYGVVAASSLLRTNTGDAFHQACGVFLGWLVATAAAVSAVVGVWRWSGLLAGLRKAVARHGNAVTGAGADDPDRPYLERHTVRQRDRVHAPGDTDDPNS